MPTSVLPVRDPLPYCDCAHNCSRFNGLRTPAPSRDEGRVVEVTNPGHRACHAIGPERHFLALRSHRVTVRGAGASFSHVGFAGSVREITTR